MTGRDSPRFDSIEFAWRVHGAQEAWTAKVDVKASILIAAQVGLLAGLAAIAASDAFDRQHSQATWLMGLAGAALVTGLGFGASVVWPRLSSEAPAAGDLIYFGHLRHKAEQAVADTLGRLRQDDARAALARQLVPMSTLNWSKHRRLQWSIGCTGIAVLLAFIGTIAGL